jgi:hypothetical protein
MGVVVVKGTHIEVDERLCNLRGEGGFSVKS